MGVQESGIRELLERECLKSSPKNAKFIGSSVR